MLKQSFLFMDYMARLLNFIIFLFGLSTSVYSQIPPDYEIVFEDEFEGTEVDKTVWNSNYEWNQSGFADYPYCDNNPEGGIKPDNYYAFRTRNYENCEVEAGTLKILSKKEEYVGRCNTWPDCASDSCAGKTCYTGGDGRSMCSDEDYHQFNYTTGMLISKERFKYGYFEIRCKIHKPLSGKTNKGIGPNFWLWGKDEQVEWSEIDIFEFGGESIFVPNVHFESGNDTMHSLLSKPEIKVDFSTFHTFSLLWTPRELRFYFDGDLITSTTRYADRLVAMPIIVDVNLPAMNYCYLPPSNAQFPHTYEIDYVKVYQKINNCNKSYILCDETSSVLSNYEEVTVNENCSPIISTDQTIDISSFKVSIDGNVKIEPGGTIKYNQIDCFDSEHIK